MGSESGNEGVKEEKRCNDEEVKTQEGASQGSPASEGLLTTHTFSADTHTGNVLASYSVVVMKRLTSDSMV